MQNKNELLQRFLQCYFLMEFETDEFLTNADFLNLIKERYDKWKREERPKIIKAIGELSSLFRKIEIPDATIEEYDTKYNKMKNRYLNL